MCGICGKIYFDSERTVSRQEVLQMSHTLAHRGPDGDGAWVKGNVGLAHRRLAIIDLRAVADQPMSNADGSIWITFNGEIYNFRELRADLEAHGHVFRTNSDTEVIIYAYEQYGRECLTRLQGMFAFAIWNERTRTLFLARDRVGKKPLFYYTDHERFVFGSEIKAILADRSLPIQPDPLALDHFLALQYIPAPLTAFQGIRKLPAAHWLEVHNGQLHSSRYWQLRYTPKQAITLPDAIEALRWRLAAAVRSRLVSDVPLGAFLSGGIDSSAVVAYMSQEGTAPVRTFAVGFEDSAFDERAFARIVAQRYHTDHAELIVKAPVTDILPRLIWHYDEPFADASAVPSYAIAALTRQHVTVVLNGDGGDENFAGYDRYLSHRMLSQGDKIPRWIWQTLAALTQRLPYAWHQHQLFRRLVKAATLLNQEPGRRYVRWFGLLAPEERQSLYTDTFGSKVNTSDPEGLFAEVFAQHGTEDGTDAALAADVQLYLADDLLVKMDRATMAHSLEARSPFLDHTLMEFVASLPAHFKLAGREKKYVLKAALRGVLPDTILERPKMGFSVPLRRWFCDELRDMAHDILLSPTAIQRGYFKQHAVAHLLEEHCAGQQNHAESLWQLLVLELWHRTFIDAGGKAGEYQTTHVPHASSTPETLA
ncbi:MAG: asparagine synthase (glutamine-hydrolyzing) [Candidatus Tectimicrobiota bacterium]